MIIFIKRVETSSGFSLSPSEALLTDFGRMLVERRINEICRFCVNYFFFGLFLYRLILSFVELYCGQEGNESLLRTYGSGRTFD